MKLATYKDGSRDGQLVVVSRDLALAHFATGIATRLQQLLDDWNFLSPQLEDLSSQLNHGKARHAFAFDPRLAMAPLPRPPARLVAASSHAHVERAAHARGTEVPADLRERWRLEARASAALQGAHDDAVFVRAEDGIDFGAALYACTGEVARGSGPLVALDTVRLLMLGNDWSLREVEAAERAAGQGLLLGQPATAFAPVAVTPDELGDVWRRGRVQLTLRIGLDGRPWSRFDAADAVQVHVGKLISHAAAVHALGPGTLVGSGVLSPPGAAHGVGSLIEQRGLEAAEHGQAATAYLDAGAVVRIDAVAADGSDVFGAIEQRVALRAAG